MDSTIRLDVQDKDDQDNGDADVAVARGVMAGKTDEVSTLFYLRLSPFAPDGVRAVEDGPLICRLQELLSITQEQLSSATSLHVNFAGVSVPNPVALRSEDRSDPQSKADHQAALDFFHRQRDAGTMAMNVVKDLHLASNAETAELGQSPSSPSSSYSCRQFQADPGWTIEPLPEAILQQMKSCHNAANEFLRQYWSAILPAQTGALGSSSATAKQAKATRMAAYLRGMEGKMNAVVHTAVTQHVDPVRVRAVSLCRNL